MSLLMDALKKAELAKRQGQTDSAAESPDAESAQGGLALEPMGSANPTQSVAEIPAAGKETPADVLPHLSSHLEELDAQFLAEAKQAASARLKPPQSSASARELGIEQPPTAETQGRAAPVKRETLRRNKAHRASRRRTFLPPSRPPSSRQESRLRSPSAYSRCWQSVASVATSGGNCSRKPLPLQPAHR